MFSLGTPLTPGLFIGLPWLTFPLKQQDLDCQLKMGLLLQLHFVLFKMFLFDR